MGLPPFVCSSLGRFGILVEAFNFAVPADRYTVRRLRHALASFQLLVFRGDPLLPQHQLRFTGYFGDLEPGIARRPSTHQLDGFPGLLHVRNTPTSPTLDYGFGWHSDGLAYARRPHGATVLNCVACPAGVGDTLFASQYDGYSHLGVQDRERLKGLCWLLPDIPHSEVPQGKALMQPFVRRHPVTRRDFLYFAPQAVRVQGLTLQDSADLTATVRASQVIDGAIYCHAWRPGDVVVWENCALLHTRADPVDVATQGLRSMYRSASAGSFLASETVAAI